MSSGKFKKQAGLWDPFWITPGKHFVYSRHWKTSDAQQRKREYIPQVPLQPQAPTQILVKPTRMMLEYDRNHKFNFLKNINRRENPSRYRKMQLYLSSRGKSCIFIRSKTVMPNVLLDTLYFISVFYPIQ